MSEVALNARSGEFGAKNLRYTNVHDKTKTGTRAFQRTPSPQGCPFANIISLSTGGGNRSSGKSFAHLTRVNLLTRGASQRHQTLARTSIPHGEKLNIIPQTLLPREFVAFYKLRMDVRALNI